MSFCTKCGRELTQNGAFCSGCGNQVAPTPQPQPQPYQHYQPYQQPQYGPAPYATPAPYAPPVPVPDPDAVPALELIKRHGSSPLFLAGVILFTVSIIAGMASLLLTSDDYLLPDYPSYYLQAEDISFFEPEPDYNDYDEDYYYYDDYFDDFDFLDTMLEVFIISILSLAFIPQITIAVALWLVYASCKKSRLRQTRLKTAGFSMVKVVHVCFLVFEMVALGMLLFVALISLAVPMDYEYGFFIMGFVLGLAVVILYCIFYNAAVFKIINYIKYILIHGKTPQAFSLMLPILVFISCGAMFFMNFVLPFSAGDLPNAANYLSLVGLSASVILSIAFIRFRAEYKNMKTKTQSL